MKHNRDGLLPVGEVIADLLGPVQALHKRPPPAQRGFTLSAQVNQLVSASEADPERGFMARLMTLCSLPRSNPGKRDRYVRKNGPYMLVMIAGGEVPKLPYGNLPRLLLAWVTTEAVRTQSRELVLGRSLSEFMRTLGINSTSGGARGEQTRLRNQMDRLFNAYVSLIYKDESGKATVNALIADRTEFWWNPKRPDESSLWESKIELGEKFFQEIIRRPVPLDMNTLKALKRSALGLDLYLWLTYRTFALKRPLALSWPQVYRQFGAHPDKASNKRTVDAFRTKCLRELKKIKLAWPGLNYTTAHGALFLLPSIPVIPPSDQGQLES